MKVYVGIPIYNGERTLKDVVKRIPKNIVDHLVLVNDGSTDDTSSVISSCMKTFSGKFKKIISLKHSKNKGYGASQKTIYETFLKMSNKDDVIVLLHADGQTMPEEISVLLKSFLHSDADIILGSRALWLKTKKKNFPIKCRKMPLYKRIGDRLLTILQNKAFGMNLSTFASGYRIFSRKALEKLDFKKLNDGHAFDSEVIVDAKIKNLKMREAPVYPFYSDEASNFSLVKYVIDVFKLIGFYKKSKNKN